MILCSSRKFYAIHHCVLFHYCEEVCMRVLSNSSRTDGFYSPDTVVPKREPLLNVIAGLQDRWHNVNKIVRTKF